ncbi:MAG: diaminopimelate dehydrogenase, partial [Anaerovoracaceae bacterium]
MTIRIGICGYGNLGRGTELAVNAAEDMELVGIFSRRDPATVKSESKVYSVEDLMAMKDEIDVLVLCGGSATDLIQQSPEYAKHFNIIDSFDTHAKIPEHFEQVNAAAKGSKHTAIISSGWDPGLFSLNRLYAEAILPVGETYTFWGKGVSQGHSDAIRRISGVANAIQYTVPVEEAVEAVRRGENPKLTTREKHLRVCYVVAEEGADKEAITETIVNMPNYFAEYDTQVSYITEEEFAREHTGMPHGGFVLRSGSTGGTHQLYEFSLALGSNPEFTASVIVAFARAVYRLFAQGDYGAKTVFEVPPYLLTTK